MIDQLFCHIEAQNTNELPGSATFTAADNGDISKSTLYSVLYDDDA